MSKFKLSIISIIVITFCIPALAGEAVVKRVPAGAVAYHFVLDVTFDSPPVELVGYLAFIEGVDGSLFDGVPSKDSAYFTVRITGDIPPPIPLPVEPDPALQVSVIPPGAQFTLFFDSTPGPRDWSSPDTFSEGVPIAVFEESAALNTGAFGGFPGVSFLTFSSKLVDSTSINFNGQKLDFKKLVPNGVTITNFGNGIRPDLTGASAGATAIAIGGNPRNKSDD